MHKPKQCVWCIPTNKLRPDIGCLCLYARTLFTIFMFLNRLKDWARRDVCTSASTSGSCAQSFG